MDGTPSRRMAAPAPSPALPDGRRARRRPPAAAVPTNAPPPRRYSDGADSRLRRVVDAGAPGRARARHVTATDRRPRRRGDASLRPRRAGARRSTASAPAASRSPSWPTVVLQLAAEREARPRRHRRAASPGAAPGRGGDHAAPAARPHERAGRVRDRPARERAVPAATPGYRWQPRALAGIAATLAAGRASRAPRWSYANTNYLLLGLVVERVTGRPLRDRPARAHPAAAAAEAHHVPSGPGIGARHLHGYIPGAGGLEDVSAYSPSSVLGGRRARLDHPRHRPLLPRAAERAGCSRASLARRDAHDRAGRAARQGRLRPRPATAAPRAAGTPGATTASCSAPRASRPRARDGRRQAVVVLNRTELTPALEKAELRLLDTAYCGIGR